jgi:hypothetical protein
MIRVIVVDDQALVRSVIFHSSPLKTAGRR